MESSLTGKGFILWLEKKKLYITTFGLGPLT